MNENENKEMVVSNLSSMLEESNSSNTQTNVITNIMDMKKIFNLENKVDSLLNDCENEIIRVKEIMIKRYLKPMKEPVIDEVTGEIVKDTELTMSTVLVDDNGKSYATGSKVFGIQLMRYFDMLNRTGGIVNGKFEPFEIKIIRKEIKNSKNKALGFELV